MKSLKFVLPCAVALFAAAPAPASARVACRSLNDAYALAGMGRNDYRSHQYRAQLRAQGRCFNVAGRAVVDDKFVDRGQPLTGGGGAYACIRPRGASYCLWTF
jgi:hypothetical protein